MASARLPGGGRAEATPYVSTSEGGPFEHDAPATLKNPMPDNTEPPLAPVYIAADVAEAERVEQLLEREEIDFEIRPEAFLHRTGDATCMQGLLFEVPAAQAQHCRHILASIGLVRGVVL